jgi:hypothetical protein
MKHIITIIIIVCSLVGINLNAQEANGKYMLKDTVVNANKNDINTSYKMIRVFNKQLKSFRLSQQQYNFIKSYKDDIDMLLNDLIKYKSLSKKEINNMKYYYGNFRGTIEYKYYLELLELEKELSIDRDQRIKTIR